MRVITSIKENSARKCRTDIAQLPTTWERPALRHKPSQAIAISRIGLRGLEPHKCLEHLTCALQERRSANWANAAWQWAMKIEFTHSAWKADILPLNYAHIKQDRKRKLGFSFHFRNLSLLSLRKTFLHGGLTTNADFWHKSSLRHGLSLRLRTIHPTLPAMYDDFTSHWALTRGLLPQALMFATRTGFAGLEPHLRVMRTAFFHWTISPCWLYHFWYNQAPHFTTHLDRSC